VEAIERRILVLRGHRVMLDRDLAGIYGVELKRLNEQVKRNGDRFPEDFMFQLTLDEGKAIVLSRSHFATMKRGRNIKYRPYVFTEYGAVMLANVLRSPLAVRASIQVVRAFVNLRRWYTVPLLFGAAVVLYPATRLLPGHWGLALLVLPLMLALIGIGPYTGLAVACLRQRKSEVEGLLEEMDRA
jgi:hypothetical protein